MEKIFGSFGDLISSYSSWEFIERRLLYRGKKGVLWTLSFEDKDGKKYCVTTRVRGGAFTIKE